MSIPGRCQYNWLLTYLMYRNVNMSNKFLWRTKTTMLSGSERHNFIQRVISRLSFQNLGNSLSLYYCLLGFIRSGISDFITFFGVCWQIFYEVLSSQAPYGHHTDNTDQVISSWYKTLLIKLSHTIWNIYIKPHVGTPDTYSHCW